MRQVEASDGFLLAAFVDAGDAAAWGHGCTEAMLEEEWWVRVMVVARALGILPLSQAL